MVCVYFYACDTGPEMPSKFLRNMNFLRRKLLALLFICCSCSLRAIDIQHFELLNTDNGLSQNAVQSIYCDSRGFMWFGTMDGLNRYDGYEFKIYRTNYNNPSSLSNSRIVSIWEDRRGFIWVESHDGHYHYLDQRTDRFYSFPSSSDAGDLRNARISSWLELSGEIWIGTTNSGVYRLVASEEGKDLYQVSLLNKEKNGLSDDSVECLVDGGNYILIGTGKGLCCFEKKKDELVERARVLKKDFDFLCGISIGDTLFLGTKNKGILQLNRKNPGEMNFLPGSCSDQITTLQASATGQLLIGTRHHGLILYNQSPGQSRTFLEGQFIEQIFKDRKGNLWVSTDKFGITRIDRNLEKAVFFELVPRKVQPLIDMQRQYLFEDRDSNIWVATHGGGAGLFDEDKMTFRFFRNNPDDPNSLSSDIAYCIEQDQAGLIWVGTGQLNGGVNKLIPSNPLFKQFRVEKDVDNLSDNVIRGIAQDNKENIWISTKSGQLCIYTKDFEPVKKFSGIPTGQGRMSRFNVYSILEDKEGYLWLGSKGGGLARSGLPLKNYPSYDKVTFQIFSHESGNPHTPSSNNIYSVMEDRKGNLWLGTYGRGIDIIEKPHDKELNFRNISTKNSTLSGDEVRFVYEDSTGRVWVATTTGLNLLSGGYRKGKLDFRSFFNNVNDLHSLSYNDVIHIYEDTTRNLWFGTFGGGLNELQQLTPQKAVFRRISQYDGLISNVVFGILEDQHGNLWLSTENGISKYDLSTGRFDNYDSDSGLQCSNFSESTCLKLRDGRLLFGALDGMLAVSDKEVKPDTYVPSVAFTHFFVLNREVAPGEAGSPLEYDINNTSHIILNYNQAGFSLEYAALSFSDPGKNRYAYMLEGFDDDWYDMKNERKASYTNVPPGDYVFTVKAASPEGPWSRPRSVKITILPPWWRTIQAYLIYLVVFLVLAEVFRRILVKYNRLRTDLRVERKVSEIKMTFFTNISHEIRTPLTLILGPLEDIRRMKDLPPSVKAPVEIMSNNGQRMLRLINQLLDFRKIQDRKMKLHLQKVDIYSMVRDACLNFSQTAVHRKILFFYPDEERPLMIFADREKIDSVLFNLLSNAFKFTPEGKQITVCVSVSGRAVSVSVKDTGIGIGKDKLPFLFQQFSTLTDRDVEFPGSGIGLAYSQELIRLHHGTIDVKSIPGEGSTFTINLLLGKEHFSSVETEYEFQPEDDSPAGGVPVGSFSHILMKTPDDSGDPGKKFKVLLVEDNPEIRNYVASILAVRYQVIHAGNGEEGILIAREKQPDMVVTDLMMPLMDGITMTRKIKEDFNLSHIPVVMLTAKSTRSDQIEGIESGAEAYVTKPFHSGYLLSVVDNLFRQRQNVLEHFNKHNPWKGKLKITDKDEEFLKSIVALIERNCQDAEFNVDKLVKESGFGRTVFYNKIKTLSGLSPVEFLRNARLQIAAQYLSKGCYSVSEAAYSSGFSDLKYFSKKFKERYQCSPSKYKEKQKTGKTD